MKTYILRAPKTVEPQIRKRNPLPNPHHADPGGKIMSSSTRAVQSRAATTLRLAAQGLNQAQNYFGDFDRRTF